MSKDEGIKRSRQTLRARHLLTWRKSGLSQGDYCRQHKIRPSTLARWLAGGQAQEPDAAAILVPVPVVRKPQPTPATIWDFEPAALSLATGRGLRLDIGKGFDAPTLARLLTVLEEGA